MEQLYHDDGSGTKQLIISSIICLVRSRWQSFSSLLRLPDHTRILLRQLSDPTIISLLFALVSATFNLRGFSISSSLPFSISKIMTSLSIPWLLSMVSTELWPSQLTPFCLRSQTMRFTDVLQAEMIEIELRGRSRAAKVRQTYAVSSVSITLRMRGSCWIYFLEMALMMGSQLRKTIGYCGLMISVKAGETRVCQLSHSLTVLSFILAFASYSSPLQTSLFDRAIIFPFILYCFFKATVFSGYSLHNLSKRLSHIPCLKASFDLITGCNCLQSPIRINFLALRIASTQTGYKHCDASSKITMSNSFGRWWMYSEDRVTNHMFFLLKY